MNELTYTLAILVIKGVLTKSEAEKIKKASTEAVLTSNLTEMTQKVNKALHAEEPAIEKISAKDFLNMA